MIGPEWKLEEDRQTVTISFPSTPPVQISLKAAQVDDVLRNLAEFRALMVPPRGEKSPAGQKVSAIPDPRWHSELDLMQGHSLLHLLDPRFGWLSYLLPPDEARTLGTVLLAQAENQIRAQQPGKSN